MAMTFELNEKVESYLPPMHVVNVDPESFAVETQEAGQKIEIHTVGEGILEQIVEIDLVPNPDD